MMAPNATAGIEINNIIPQTSKFDLAVWATFFSTPAALGFKTNA
jgi:hypothetical protein